MQLEDVKLTSRSNPSQRIIAAAIVFAFLYFASDVVVTLLLAVLIAYFLDPVVGLLERIHIPRALGALVVLLAVTAIFAGLGYLVVLRANQFIDDWPRYSEVLRHVTTAFDRQMTTLEKGVEAIAPAAEKGRTPLRTVEPPPVREWLLRGAGSLYSILWWRRSFLSWFSSCSPQNPAFGKPRLIYSRTNIRSASGARSTKSV
jgi:predicted PurR-regulated permease PerM